MIARGAASIILAGALALGMTGCGFLTPQATLIQYAPSDGVQTDVGDIKVRNAIAISDEEGVDASLVMSIVNPTDDDITLEFQYEDSTGKATTAELEVPANATLSLGNTGEEQLVFRGVQLTEGSLFPVYLQYGSFEGSQLLVPVLPSDHSEYDGLHPTPAPTLEPTLAPTETPAP